MNKELKRWLKANNACKQGIDSVLKNKITDMRDAYNRAEPEYLVWAVTCDRVMTQRDCIRFALFCVKQVQDKLTDERSKAVIPALEGWLEGRVTQAEIQTAAAASRAAAHAAVYTAVYAATVAAAASRAAAHAAVYTATAATAAVDAATAATAAATARKAQAEWIRANVPFESLNLKIIR
jgi:hypothetical protein